MTEEPDKDEEIHRLRIQVDRRIAVVFLVTLIAVPTGLTILLYAAWGVDGWWRTCLTLLIPAWWAYVGHWMYTVLGIPVPWDRRYRP